MKSAAFLKRLADLQKPRIIACEKCGKKTTVRGAAALLLCPEHKAAHTRARLAKKRKEKQSRAEPDSTVSSLRPISDPQIPVSPVETMRDTPPAVRHEKSNRPHAPMEIRSGNFAEAVSLITAPTQNKEGYRTGWIANTGAGKTTSIRRLLQYTSPAFTLIHDDSKLDAQYPGIHLENFNQLPPSRGAETMITIRGDAYKGSRVEVNTVADLALRIARQSRQAVRIVVDELDRACTAGGKQLESGALRDCFTLGRALSLSVVWSTQTPQRAPVEVIDQSSTIAIGQLGPRAINYLDERLQFDPDLLAVVPLLPVGRFVIYESGRPWNRTIYETPAD